MKKHELGNMQAKMKPFDLKAALADEPTYDWQVRQMVMVHARAKDGSLAVEYEDGSTGWVHPNYAMVCFKHPIPVITQFLVYTRHTDLPPECVAICSTSAAAAKESEAYDTPTQIIPVEINL